MDRFLNKLWFAVNFLGYFRFLKKVAEAGYDRNDIWYSRKLGFLCFPPGEVNG
jgi:hypothetical protein